MTVGGPVGRCSNGYFIVAVMRHFNPGSIGMSNRLAFSWVQLAATHPTFDIEVVVASFGSAVPCSVIGLRMAVAPASTGFGFLHFSVEERPCSLGALTSYAR